MRFAAFISYSHSGDARVAAAIQSGLQQFAKPWHKRRALNVFRDQTNLGASPGLWPSIERALQESEWFVLMPRRSRRPRIGCARRSIGGSPIARSSDSSSSSRVAN
jgi:hypothetical protein